MIMNNRKVFYDENLWEKLENKIKSWTYGLMHELLQNQVCSPFLYKLLILIETIQLIYYSLHPNLKFLFKTEFLDYFRQVIQYFQINSILNTGGENVFLTILYLVFSVQLIMLLLIIIITYKISSSKRKTSTFLTYVLKIVSLYGLLLNTIITIPFFNILIVTLFCDPQAPFSNGFDCYKDIYFLHISMAIFGMILLFIYNLIFGLLYIELNPNSMIPFAAPQSKTILIKQLLKLLLPFYVTLDFNGTITKEFVSILAVYYLVLLIQRYRTAPYYNQGVYYCIMVSEVILTWVTLVSVIHAFLDMGAVDDIGLFYMVLGAPFICLAYCQLIDRKQMGILKIPIKSFKKEVDVENYVIYLMQLIENRENAQSTIYLEGVLKLHLKNCLKSDCVCAQLAQDNLREEDTPQKQKRWYFLVRSIMIDVLDKFQKCPRLHLLNAYIHHEKLKNKFKALFELMITEENKPNVQEQFSIYRYKNLIEEEMIENDQRNSEQKGVDVNIIVVFQNKFVVFLGSIEKSVNLHLEFWRELLEENPDIQKLQQLGSKITNTVENTNDLFKRLNDMNPNHIKCLEIYGNFLRDIVNDDVEGQRILEKAEYIGKSTVMNKQFIDNDRQKYGENSNTCIVTTSGNFNNVGIVTNTNNEIIRILGYSKADLIGQNVNRIMPKVFSDHHDVFMRTYLETSEAKIAGQERLIQAQNKLGYLVPCTLMIKVLPNLDEGIQIVGFLKDIEEGGTYMKQEMETDEKVHYVLYNYESFVIMGVTQSCYQSFGIPASLVYGNTTNSNEFTLDAIAPELGDMKNYDELKSTGMITTLDTTGIQQNFLLGHGDSEDELSELDDELHIYQGGPIGNNQSQIQSKFGDTQIGNQNQFKETVGNPKDQNQSVDLESKKKKKSMKYRKAKIRAQVVGENEFGDQRVCTLKFLEVDEADEMRQQKSVENLEVEAIQGKSGQKQEEGKSQQQQQQQGDINNSDQSSNVSGASINDDMRQLKDFKALISEKTEPKSIRILKRTVLFLMSVLISLTSVILAFRIYQNQDVSEGASAFFNSYYRLDMQSDINYYVRMLQLLAIDIYKPNNNQPITLVEDQFKTNISYLVDLLQNVQFDTVKARIKMESRMSEIPELEKYPVIFKLQNGDTKTYENIYNDALFQYITSASSIRNSSLSSFLNKTDENGTLVIGSTQKNFFYVNVNGYYVLRKGGEFISQRFFDFYVEEIQKYKAVFIAIMSVALFFLVVSQFILIPIVFQVHKTNNRVMSLFGIIPIQEIKELASKCEKYIFKFLEDKNNKNLEQDEKNEEGEGEGVTVKENEIENKEAQPNYFEVNNEDMDQNNIQPKTEGMHQLNTANINTNIVSNNQTKASHGPSALTQGLIKNDPRTGLGQQNEEKKENEEEVENLRSQKLLNSKDNNRSIVIIQFGFFALLFIAYFIVDIILEMMYLDNVDRIYKHLHKTCMRPWMIKYTVYYTLEEIVTGVPQLEDGIDLRERFQGLVYGNERDIFTSLKEKYPIQFDGYRDKFEKFNYQNLCEQRFDFLNFTMQKIRCEDVDNGLLIKGLRTAVVSVVLACNDMISEWESTQKGKEDVITQLNSQQFEKLQYLLEYIGPSVNYLNTVLMNDLDGFLGKQDEIEVIKFVVFIVFMCLVFLIFWTPYLNNLSKQIWRTKGMLNMIPMEIIQKYENLKQQFIGGDILQAVR